MSTSKEKSSSNNGGIGFVGALTILFIALKLLGYITWSWYWVLSPIWISAIALIPLLIIIYLTVRE
jgi:hypothetical protein